MVESRELVFNVAFTVPVNDDPESPVLTLEEFWRGLRRGGEKPYLFADYVADTEVLGRKSENEFTRRLIMADGAVHTAKGAVLEQNVRNAENLLTEAITIDSGARSTMLISRGGRESDKPTDLFLTAVYELHVPGVVPESDRAKEIQEEYSLLARGAARTVVAKIREWKANGTLEQ
ncbi:SRPBCC family protein [Aspergillus thermomutatus]|uniref:Uncharacterized protein n=1 Tax=Aspergillus thermomutatus TaxID=41047 RepID=A0A397G828_ASPTH|nr:uncharacterized protein CDV56_102022 [Aspergillus thermomutatus]RHZ46024.1 hypothetical protein CDV56_102022 [Aspergillus thermomutatus]